MRFVAIALSLVVTSACAPTGAMFEHQSTMYEPTRGIVLNDDTAQAGMFSNTCAVAVRSGMIGEDVDVAESEDVVEDSSGGVILVRGSDGLHFYEPGDWGWGSTPDVAGGDIVDGTIVDGGVVAVHDTGSGLQVEWTADGSRTNVAGSGLSDLGVDRASGTAFVVADGEVSAVTAEGSTALGSGDMVVWDSVAEVLYVADADGTELRGIEADGGVRWATEVGGTAASLESLGGRAIISVDTGIAGSLVIVDGFTGDILSAQGTPGGADELSASESGSTLAVALPNQVHFFSIR